MKLQSAHEHRRWRVTEALSERRHSFRKRGRRDPFPIVALLLVALGIGLVMTLNSQLATRAERDAAEQQVTSDPASEAPQGEDPAAAEEAPGDISAGGIEPVVGEEFRFATERHINELGGYAFAYPPKWQLTEDGAVSKITTANRDVLVSFGLGPAGSLASASERFMTILERSYDDFELVETRSKTFGANPGFQYKGTAVNQSGLPIRFLTVVMQGRFGNYAIASFTASDAGGKYTADIREVLRSFRTAD